MTVLNNSTIGDVALSPYWEARYHAPDKPAPTVEWATAGERHESWIAYVVQAECVYCGSPYGHCYFICPNSPEYCSPERERADALWQEALSDGEYMSIAVSQYEREHGQGSYCS